MNKRMDQRTLWLGLGACLLGAFVLRLINLGSFSFWIDELYHIFAAQSYLNDGSFFVPFKGDYTRSLPTTYITIAVFKMFGVSETVARLPMVLLNMVFLFVFFLFTRHFFSDRTALLGTGILALAPFEVALARECRMYGAFQLFYFLASMTFLMGLENSGPGKKKKYFHLLDVNFTWLAVSGVFLLISKSFHLLSMNLGFVAVAYCLVMVLVVAYEEGPMPAIFSKYMAVLLLAGLALLGLFLFQPGFMNKMIFLIKDIPPNFVYINPAGAVSYYRYFLTDNYPLFFFLYPLGAFLLVRSYGKKGIFVVLSFLVLLFFHSVLFERKSPRYIFYVFPFFILAVTVAIEKIFPLVVDLFNRETKNQSPAIQILALFCLIPTLYGITHPWLLNSLKTVRSSPFPNWMQLSESRKEVLKQGTVITGNPNEFTYYMGTQPSYYFMADYNPKIHTYEPGRLVTLEDLKKAIDDHDNAVVITTRFTFANNANFTAEMRSYVRDHMDPVENKGTSILMFKKKEKEALRG